MPLSRIPIPGDLITVGHGGTTAMLNRAAYPDFEIVEGEPSYTAVNPDRGAALREAFAALQVAKRREPQGTRQRVYLGEAAIELAYGRRKRDNEPDCDVIGYLAKNGGYGFLLAEGKGADLCKATDQFHHVATLLEHLVPRTPDGPRAGPILGGIVVMNSLRYLQWHPGRKMWIAYLNLAEDKPRTDRLQQNIQRADPGLQVDKVYLSDGPHDDHGDMLPSWTITPGKQPFTVYEHQRSKGARSFVKVPIGIGPLEIYYVT